MGEPHPRLKMGHFRLGCDSPPSRFLQTRSCKWCPSKGQGYKMLRFRNYWIYSAGLAIAWAVVLILVQMIGSSERAQTTQLVFLGFCIGWVSTTIARYVYPPPKRWELNRRQE